MKEAIGGFIATLGVVGFALIWALTGAAHFKAFVVPACSFLVTLAMPTNNAIYGCVAFFGGIGLLLFLLTGFDDPVGVGLALVMFVYVGVFAGAVLNFLVRFLWRKWRAAQQRAPGDVRDARA